MSPSGTIELDVSEAPSSMSGATYSVDGGPSRPVPHGGVRYLTSDPGRGGFAIIAVDEATGEARGIAAPEGARPMTVAQTGKGDVILTAADEFEPPEWSCGADHLAEHSPHQEEAAPLAETPHEWDAVEEIQLDHDDRELRKNENGKHLHHHHLEHEHHHHHNHHQHGHAEHHGDAVEEIQMNYDDRELRKNENGKHLHHHHHEHHHHHVEHHGHVHMSARDLDGSTFEELMKAVSIGGGIQPRHSHASAGGTYPTDTFPNRYSYEVQLYIEIDALFVDRAGGGNLTVALRYVDLMTVAASRLFEREVDTRLVVRHVAQTTLYDRPEVNTTLAAFNLMRSTYGDANGWHYEEGGIDLHHALLGKRLGGGIAWVGAVCDSRNGFGVSSNIQGNFASMDAATVWDFKVFVHELGHNFGSVHTHDPSGYDPLVDTCGVRTTDDPPQWTCSAGLPLEGSSTLMGYCHLCPGGMSNVEYTFGGTWHEDNRRDFRNWMNSDLRGAVSFEPRRVSTTMWAHVSSRGTCVEPEAGSVPVFTCTDDGGCNDGNSCTEDACNGGQCTNTPLEDCCGNFVCEAGELGSCSDCGPFTLEAPGCSGLCWIPRGMMFDISTKEGRVTIQGLRFRVYAGSGLINSDVTVYLAPGSYEDKYGSPALWAEIHTTTISAPRWSWVNLDFDGVDVDGNYTLYIHLTSGSLVGSKEASNPVASDNHIRIHAPARAINSVGHFGVGTSSPNGESISWEGGITYSLKEQCSDDSDCFDGDDCTIDTCLLGTCERSISYNCCGNGVCEIEEPNDGGDGCSEDCGAWDLDAPMCYTYGNEKCYAVPGLMFDLAATSDITVSSITIWLNGATNATLQAWTTEGSHNDDDRHSIPLEWRYLDSWGPLSFDRLTRHTIPIPPTDILAGRIQSFYLFSSAGGFLCGSLPPPAASDGRARIQSPARVFVQPVPFSPPSYNSFSFQGGITYTAKAVPGPTASPFGVQTMSPTLNPTLSLEPTLSQSSSVAPSNIPPVLPSTYYPSASYEPTLRTSQNPSASLQPTPFPSAKPTDKPSVMPSERSEAPSMSLSRASSHSPSRSLIPTDSLTKNPTDSLAPTARASGIPSSSPMPSKTTSTSPSFSIRPSAAESNSPSESASPTGLATPYPSASLGPTLRKSPVPSIMRSTMPSILPTVKHSLDPSTSSQPSVVLSGSPSESLSPTGMATPYPSASFGPTVRKSPMPSIKRSTMPSILPTVKHSLDPSTSSQPSAAQSISPSQSVSPTGQTTPSPSASPGPTLRKSPMPSMTRSTMPSTLPTVKHSLDPSTSSLPSVAQSSFPSVSASPTGLATPYPSASVGPTVRKSPVPSIKTSPMPSILPTVKHSLDPSTSSLPSVALSGSPSESVSPTDLPTSQPSASLDPSVRLSSNPSIKRSEIPSILPSDQHSLAPSTTFQPSEEENQAPPISSPPTEKPTQSPITTTRARWFMSWDALRCKKDCEGDPPCGGQPPYWANRFKTAQECCTESFHWYANLVAECIADSSESLFP